MLQIIYSGVASTTVKLSFGIRNRIAKSNFNYLLQLNIFHFILTIKSYSGVYHENLLVFRYPILLLVKNQTFPPRTICCDGPKGQHINIQVFTFKILPNLGEMVWHLVLLFIVIDQIYWIGGMLKRKGLVNVWKQHFILPKGNMVLQDCWILKVSRIDVYNKLIIV